MRIRTILSVAMACALVAVNAAQGAVGVAGVERMTMKGRTGQHYRIALRARGRTVEIMRFTIRLSCRDGSELIDEESGFQRTPVRRGGSFHDDQVGSTDEVLFGGRLRGHAARGRVRVKDRLGSGVRCDSHWVRFLARARR